MPENEISEEKNFIVETDGVTKVYESKTAVSNLDLAIPAGICFGLLGPNGAGKTTPLRMLYGVTEPTRGQVRVFGQDVARNVRAIRTRLGVTLQENVMIDNLSPRINLRIFGRHHLIPEAELTRRIDHLLDFLELRSHEDMPVITLSGGFQRRLAVAMSLINDPELLILDEPTTGLDPAVRHALWSKIRQLKSDGKTVLLTTHYMDEAERLCDQVMIVAGGKSIRQGPPRELIQSELHPEAVEFDCTEAEEQLLTNAIGNGVVKLRSGNRLMVFAEDATPVLNEVHKMDGGERRPVIVRPANLEDVFLSVTGAQLGEDQ